MKVVVPHRSTQQKAASRVDQGSDILLGGEFKNVQIVDRKKEWAGPVMNFSFTGKLGFISIPLTGTVTVDDTNVTVECELPAMLKTFLGEEKVQALMQKNVEGLLLKPGTT